MSENKTDLESSSTEPRGHLVTILSTKVALVVAYVCMPSIWEVEAGGSGLRDWIPEVKAYYMRPIGGFESAVQGKLGSFTPWDQLSS